MLRVVLDTNVIISAVTSKGKPRELLHKGIENRFQIVASEYTLKELGTRWGLTRELKARSE